MLLLTFGRADRWLSGAARSCQTPRMTETAPLVPPALLDPVVAYFNPGSAARGGSGPDSDIDLLVIVDDDTPAEKVTLKAGYESRGSYHQPADVIPVRERIFRR